MVKLIYFLFTFFIKIILYSSPIFIGTSFMILIALIFYIIGKKYLVIKRQYFYNNVFYVYKMLDFYFIKNIYFEILILFGILNITFGFLLILRFMTFGIQYNLWILFQDKEKIISYLFFINIILAFLSFSFYLKNLLPILRDTYYKIHVYCLKYNQYYSLVDHLWFRFYSSTDNGITTKIQILCEYILNTKSYFLSNYSTGSTYLKFITFFSVLQKNKSYIRFIFSMLTKIAKFFNNFENMCLYYWPTICLFIFLLFDLLHNEFYYIYYGLFFYTLISLYRKYRQFLGHTDFREIDIKLTDYFYKNNIHVELVFAEPFLKTHSDFWKILFKCKTGIVSEIYDLPFIEKIKEYFNRNFIVDYVDINFKKSYQPYNIRLLFFCIFILYYIFCYNLVFIYNIFLSLPLLFAIIFYEFGNKCTNWKFVHILKFISLNFFIFSVIIFIYIYLTRHNFYFINENLWNWKINIVQAFSVEEKIEFMKAYLNFKTKYLSKDVQQDLRNIFEHISFTDLIEDIPISRLKAYIENLIITYNKVTKIYLIIENRQYYKYLQYVEKSKKGFLYRLIKHIFI